MTTQEQFEKLLAEVDKKIVIETGVCEHTAVMLTFLCTQIDDLKASIAKLSEEVKGEKSGFYG